MFNKKNTALLTSLLMTGITANISAGKGSFESSPAPAPAPVPQPTAPITPSLPSINDPKNPYYDDIEQIEESNKKQTHLLQLLAGGGSAVATAVGGLGMLVLQTVVSNKTKSASEKKQSSYSAFFPNNSDKNADKEIFLQGISQQLEENTKDSKAVIYSGEPDKAGLLNSKAKKENAHANRVQREDEILANLEKEVAKEKAIKFGKTKEILLKAHKNAGKILENDRNAPRVDDDMQEIQRDPQDDFPAGNYNQQEDNQHANQMEQVKVEMGHANNQAAIHSHLEAYYLAASHGEDRQELLRHPEVKKIVEKAKREFAAVVIHTPSISKHLAKETKARLHQEARGERRSLELHNAAPRETR